MAQRILLTGASGYVGGRLLPALEAAGYRVRCLARHPEFLAARVAPGTEVWRGDVLDLASLAPALADVDTAFYLVHSMGSAHSFVEQDRVGARNFGAAARRAGVRRIIYLGGLGEDRSDLSDHLRSRHEVGDLLRQSGVEVVELRASIVIGSGSLSFEMVRSLTEHLPVMVMPRWVRVRSQPIAIQDLLAYLMQSIALALPGSRVIEIGGADQVSYRDLMVEYARQRGLRRIMIPVPVLTARLSSLWLGLVTPLYARVGRKLIESIAHPTVVRDDSARHLFSIAPQGVAASIATALRNEDREFAASHWFDALSSSGSPASAYGGRRVRGRLLDVRERLVAVPPAAAFEPIRRIGGANGWYAWNSLWRLRGWLDLLSGGVGLRRGRPAHRALRAGDSLDFWRVETYDPPRRLRLFAEMRVPGRAWLEFEVEPAPGGARIRQTAVFHPNGLAGLLYWYGIYPLHALVFRAMVAAIAQRAERPAATGRLSGNLV
ncbi:MAG: SDR family oxidoreductase [Candidatus Binatia bacterium]